MIDEDAKVVSAALVSFLQGLARLFAQELRQQPGAQAVLRMEEPHGTYQSQRLLKVNKAADFLQVKPNRVYEIAHWKGPDGLRCVRIGRQIRFRMEDIEAYLGRQARGGP